MASKAVFLDRDGTVNTEEDFLSDPEKLRLESGAVEGLKILRDAGFTLVVVSNQSGVARGLFSEDDVARISERLGHLLAEDGVNIERFYYCPHHPEGSEPEYSLQCQCRKPSPGMLLRAADELDIDPAASYMVGDRARDLEAGRRAGTQTVLVKTGYGPSALDEVLEMKLADFVAEDLVEAACWIVAQDRGMEEVDDNT
ncbi:MAG: D-glycero-beta-D-manno-heptose 1,7-bisphosphate 7-phosphatase [Planctomycetota bacterium]|jgi:D,D-heptose 1,7-bisphosphate phosphatase